MPEGLVGEIRLYSITTALVYFLLFFEFYSPGWPGGAGWEGNRQVCGLLTPLHFSFYYKG
jgi:hypothetical protein